MGSGYAGMSLEVKVAQHNDMNQKVFNRDIFGGN
jgi:hypothetical protein